MYFTKIIVSHTWTTLTSQSVRLLAYLRWLAEPVLQMVVRPVRLADPVLYMVPYMDG